MNQTIRIPRSTRKCFVKLTPDNHVILAYFSHQHKTTMTNALNSVLGGFFLKYYQIKDSKELDEMVKKTLVRRRSSAVDKLFSFLFRKRKRRPRLHFKDTNIAHSSETQANPHSEDKS